MHSIREIAKGIITEMEKAQKVCSPESLRYHMRLAVITYADFLKHSPVRSKAMNQQCLEEARVYAEQAIASGTPEWKIEKAFERLRRYWVPRLKGEANARP